MSSRSLAHTSSFPRPARASKISPSLCVARQVVDHLDQRPVSGRRVVKDHRPGMHCQVEPLPIAVNSVGKPARAGCDGSQRRPIVPGEFLNIGQHQKSVAKPPPTQFSSVPAPRYQHHRAPAASNRRASSSSSRRRVTPAGARDVDLAADTPTADNGLHRALPSTAAPASASAGAVMPPSGKPIAPSSAQPALRNVQRGQFAGEIDLPVGRGQRPLRHRRGRSPPARNGLPRPRP